MVHICATFLLHPPGGIDFLPAAGGKTNSGHKYTKRFRNEKITETGLHHLEIVLSGYVNIFLQRSAHIFPARTGAPGPFVERIAPDAVHWSLLLHKWIPLRIDHRKKIGSVWDGSICLHEDSNGLHVVARISDKSVIAAACRSNLRGWSFAFIPIKSEWEKIGSNLYCRTIKRAILVDISILIANKPAYPGTIVTLKKISL